MSNTMVGGVYQKIMDEVIENCIVTFEEDGVERRLLDEVKKTWQSKLTERRVAVMPWDPAPAASSASSASQNASSGSKQSAASHSSHAKSSANANTAATANGSSTNGSAPAPTIKAEPQGSYDLQNLPPSNGVPSGTYSNATAALDRASQELHNRFGAQANASISQLQAKRAASGSGGGGSGSGGGGASGAGGGAGASGPATGQQQQSNPTHQAAMAEQRQKMAAQQGAQMRQAQQQQQKAVGNAQTDGPAESPGETLGDWQSLAAERRALAGTHAAEADASLRDLLGAHALQLEGGGVFRPVSQVGRKVASKRAVRRARGAGGAEAVAAAAGAEGSLPAVVAGVPLSAVARGKLPTAAGPPPPGRYDGADSEDDKIKDEEDEDAINSELDDSEDEQPEGAEEDDDRGEIMLCTYDKVQRVKNKWKCTLKDGVLTTGNKEYVFHKAQGEFEW